MVSSPLLFLSEGSIYTRPGGVRSQRQAADRAQEVDGRQEVDGGPGLAGERRECFMGCWDDGKFGVQIVVMGTQHCASCY